MVYNVLAFVLFPLFPGDPAKHFGFGSCIYPHLSNHPISHAHSKSFLSIIFARAHARMHKLGERGVAPPL